MSNKKEGHSAGSILLAFILGGLVGAGITLLMAPHSGRETRDKIKDIADEIKDKASDYAGKVKEKVTSTVEHGKEFIGDKKSLISSAVEAGKEAYEKEKEKRSQ
jgi:gas vesicle protein